MHHVIVSVQLGFMPERGIIDGVFISRMLEEHHAKGKKLYICLVDLEEAFDRVQQLESKG